MRFLAGLLVLPLMLLSLAAAGEPRGYSNNNPGNIVKTTISWEGEKSCDDPRFECFSTPYYGIRAMTKNLIYYYHVYELTSIDQIIHRWAPPQENNTDAYAQFLRLRVGELRDNFYARLPRLVQAMMYYENGEDVFSYDFIEEVVHDTVRDSDFTRLDAARGDDEVIRQAPRPRESEAFPNDAGIDRNPRRTDRDSVDTGQEIYMDTPIHSNHSGPISIRRTEASSFLRPRRGVWMDGVQSRVLVLYRW